MQYWASFLLAWCCQLGSGEIKDLDKAAHKHKANLDTRFIPLICSYSRSNLQSPGLLLCLKGDKAVSLWDPCPVLDNLCLLHISKGRKQRMKLRLCCGRAYSANKNPKKFLVTNNLEIILCLDVVEMFSRWRWCGRQQTGRVVTKINSWRRKINYDSCGSISCKFHFWEY